MSTLRSSCPIVRAEVLSLFERVEVAGKYRMLPFENRILWLRQSEAKIVLRHHDGIEITTGATLNDWYGFLSSLKNGVTTEVAGIAQKLNIGKGDRLSVDVDLIITDTPVLPDESLEAKEDERRYKGQAYRKSYVNVPSYYNGGKYWHTSDVFDKDGALPPRLEAVTYLEREAMFSTARSGVCKDLPVELVEFIRVETEKGKVSP